MAETEPNEHSHLARGLAISGFLIQLMYLGSDFLWTPQLKFSSFIHDLTKPPQSLSLQGLWEMVLHQECAAESPGGLGIIAGPQAWVRSAVGREFAFLTTSQVLLMQLSFENCCSGRHRPTNIIQAETSVI